jgi:hypothetical protein
VEDGSGLVLAVTSPSEGRELVEEGAAVREDVRRREGVSEHAGRARSVDIGAVSASGAAGSTAAIASHGTEASGDGAADIRGSALKEFLEFSGRAGCGGGGSVRGKAAAIVDSGADGSTTTASTSTEMASAEYASTSPVRTVEPSSA